MRKAEEVIERRDNRGQAFHINDSVGELTPVRSRERIKQDASEASYRSEQPDFHDESSTVLDALFP